MLPQEIIRKKRDGKVLTREEIQFFVKGITDNSLNDAQVAAFAMSVYFQGLSRLERTDLTRFMRDSGFVLNWDYLDGPVVDKHSTGGIGDLVSLVLAPLLSACGVYVPMISGRGLGHTGGTLDKLDSIPGYKSQPDMELFKECVGQCGLAIIGQTLDLAPADRRLYAIRDIAGCIESIDLICASILSKKLASGLQSLILDIKTGNGAFMDSLEKSRELGESLKSVAMGLGCETEYFITDMNEPLASCAGNALEVEEAVVFLKNERVDPRLQEVTVALGGQLLVLCGAAKDITEGGIKIKNALSDGSGLERFAKMVSFLGGPEDFCENTRKYLPQSPLVYPVHVLDGGIIRNIDTRRIGLNVIKLGGGRTNLDDVIDYSVGFSQLKRVGQFVDASEPIGYIHARTKEQVEIARLALLDAYTLGEEMVLLNPVVYP